LWRTGASLQRRVVDHVPRLVDLAGGDHLAGNGTWVATLARETA
jgi:hypothetical protein